MPANQKNFSYFEYLDDNGETWNVRGEDGGAFSAVDGHTTDYANPAWGANTRRRHVRYVIARHPTTFRTVRGIIYTPTAYNAIGAGDTVNVAIAGDADAEAYTVVAKVPERQPLPAASRHLTEVA